MIYVVGLVVVVCWILIWLFIRGSAGGCGGSCNQGRTKCDCKNIF